MYIPEAVEGGQAALRDGVAVAEVQLPQTEPHLSQVGETLVPKVLAVRETQHPQVFEAGCTQRI